MMTCLRSDKAEAKLLFCYPIRWNRSNWSLLSNLLLLNWSDTVILRYCSATYPVLYWKRLLQAFTEHLDLARAQRRGLFFDPDNVGAASAHGRRINDPPYAVV